MNAFDDARRARALGDAARRLSIVAGVMAGVAFLISVTALLIAFGVFR